MSDSTLFDDGPDRDLLTPTQLADRWGVTTGHLANLRHRGEGIGYLKIGSRVAYRFCDVVAFETSTMSRRADFHRAMPGPNDDPRRS